MMTLNEQIEAKDNRTETKTEARPNGEAEHPPGDNSHPAHTKHDDIPALEWIVAIIGLVLVAGSIGFILYQASKGDSAPPRIDLTVSSVRSVGNGYLVQVQVTNQGGATVKGLVVEGQLKNGASPVEASETTLDYVPAYSSRNVGLFYTQDPQRFQLHLRAKGYEEP